MARRAYSLLAKLDDRGPAVREGRPDPLVRGGHDHRHPLAIDNDLVVNNEAVAPATQLDELFPGLRARKTDQDSRRPIILTLE